MEGTTIFGSIGTGDDLVVRYDGTTAALATIETAAFLNQTDQPTRVVSGRSLTATEPLEDTEVEIYELRRAHRGLRTQGHGCVSDSGRIGRCLMASDLLTTAELREHLETRPKRRGP